MNYLIYIEHAAENLQFFLWYKDYLKRFEALPEREKALAQPIAAKSEEAMTPRGPPRKPKISPEAAKAFDGTAFAPIIVVSEKPPNPFEDDARSSITRPSLSRPGSRWDDETTTLQSSTRANHQQSAASAYEAAEVKLQPFTIQPFREEVTRIIAIYVSDGAPRQLNLASKERTELLHNLASTTHPSAFRNVLRTVEWSLRRQAHPNFIRWTICNGNPPRVIFARGLGIGGIAGGIIIALLLTLSHNGRAWRVLAAIPFLIGIATLFAAWKGMCVVLHGMHHRHLRPWELFADADEAAGSTYNLENDSMDSFGSANSYEDEPWIAKYEKRNIVRKVFDREVWIQEPALRQIQDTIFIQAILSGVLVTAIITGAFCAIPLGNKI
ncbi:MAG: hypothetical protein MMC23_008145 [Stictis urceolatum]|nr:hypothetical protein [Stictis urceolata]